MRMIRVIAVALGTTLCAFAAEQRHFAYADAVQFLSTEAAAKQLKRVVFAVHIPGNRTNQDTRDDWRPIGTGFFVHGPDKELFGVTCFHIISAAEKAKATISIGVDTEAGYLRLPCQILVRRESVDLVVVGVLAPNGIDLKVTNIAFPMTMFDDGESLVEGRGVLIPGYPLSLGVEDDRNHPVVRMGMIAQNTQRDFFLIDGMASHGNSGSPVFALRYKGDRLVGMVTAYVNDRIVLNDESGAVVAQLPYNSGLARAVRTSVIRSALEEAGKMASKMK